MKKYNITSAEAAKLLKKITEEVNILLSKEKQSSTFCVAYGEDVESLRPEYNYEETQKAVDKCNEKIRIIKHALNVHNSKQLVGDTGLTIDQVLVYIPQLSDKRHKLQRMQDRLPKQRASANYGSNIIDYVYTNYSPEQVKEDYIAVSDELRKLQLALDTVNTTVRLEFELPD